MQIYVFYNMLQLEKTSKHFRLGTRGNSRYCYAGLRKRIKLDTPVTPDISAEPGRSRDSLVGSEEEVNNAAGFLIREWVEKLLGVKFDNLPDLACHLLEKMYVDNRSVAAFTLLSRAGKFDVKAGSMPPMPPSNGTDSKLQLQRKLQEVNMNMKSADQHKRKLVEHEMVMGKRSKVSEEMTDNYDVNLNYDGGAVGGPVGVVQGDTKILADNQNRFSVVVQNNQNNQPLDPVFINGNNGIASFETGGAVNQGTSGEFQVSYNGERIEAVMAGPGARQVTSSSISLDKLPRKKQVVLVGGGDLNNGLSVTSVIKAGEKPRSKYKEEIGALPEPEVWPREAVAAVSDPGVLVAAQYDTEPADLSSLRNWSGGSGGPDNHEEELVQYFSNQEIGEPENESEKLSQIRQLLTKNLTPIGAVSQLSGGAFKRTNLPFREPGPGKLEAVAGSEAVDPASGVQTDSMTGQLSTRRRVSFHPLIVSDADTGPSSGGGAIHCPVPPSPGTRRRHFSFQPISPRAQGPGGQSPPASPFISPRSTPVHMLRSRHSSGSALPLHLLPGGERPRDSLCLRHDTVTISGSGGGGRQQHPSGSGSDISRAATFGSASESSTPFISPMGTPIPFNIR